jgi:hypothetical protein
MYGLGVNRLGVTKTSEAFEWEPTNLFANGEQGAWYDPSDLTTLFQNSDGTTAVAVGDPVGYLGDKSGNENHAIAANSAKRPTLRQAGSLYYLEFEGAQGLKTSGNVNFTGTDTMTVCTGVKKEVDASENIVELSTNAGGNVGSFRLAVNSGSQYRYGSRGDSVLRNATATGYSVPSTNVVTGFSDISADIATIRVDGVEKATQTLDQGTGNYGSYELNVGARNNGGGLQFEGFIYSLVIRNVVSNTADLASTETYVAAKTGVSL